MNDDGKSVLGLTGLEIRHSDRKRAPPFYAIILTGLGGEMTTTLLVEIAVVVIVVIVAVRFFMKRG